MIPKTVDEKLLFSTLRVERFSKNGQIDGIGTSFLFFSNSNKLLLISNKHVLFGGTDIRVTFNVLDEEKTGPSLGKMYQLTLQDYMKVYHEHPDPRIDIACLNISEIIPKIAGKVYYHNFDESLLANFQEEELDVSQRVTFVGYPDNRFDIVHNLPIIRSGLIASHPKVDFNGIKQFIIDAQVFPGSSGSPVMINLTYENYKNGTIVIEKPKIRLLGIVAATMIRNSRVVPLPSNYPSLLSQEVIGLGIVFKSTALKELIEKV